MRTLLRAVLGTALLLAGCGSNDDRAGSAVEDPNTVNYGSFGTKASIDCGPGKALNVGGSNNTLKVTGTCSSVSVAGADNTIAIARVEGALSVEGLNNTISFRSGDPKISDSGSGNRIRRG